MKFKLDRTINLYYFSSFLSGIRFLIPIWLIWYTKFISQGTIGLLEATGFMLGMLLEVPTGALADVFGRKNSVAIGKFGIAVAAFFVAFTTGKWMLIVGALVWNIFSVFISGADTALVYDHLKEQGNEHHFSLVNSRAVTIARIGIIISSFLGGVLYNFWNPLPYVLFGVTNIIEAIVWLQIKEPRLDSEKFSFVQYKKAIVGGFLEIRKSYETLFISGLAILMLSYGSLLREYYNYSYALDLHLDASQQSLLFGGTAILKMIGVLGIGAILVKFKRSNIMTLFFLVLAFVLLPSQWLGVVGGIVVIALAEMVTAAAPLISDTYINKLFDSKHRATAMSVINMCSTFIQAIGVWLGLSIIENVGSPRVYTVIGASLIALTLASVLLFRKHRKSYL